jgi:hypothetical protein
MSMTRFRVNATEPPEVHCGAEVRDGKLVSDMIADTLTDRDWIVLRAEFEAGALRSERIRKALLRCIESRFTTVESWLRVF